MDLTFRLSRLSIVLLSSLTTQNEYVHRHTRLHRPDGTCAPAHNEVTDVPGVARSAVEELCVEELEVEELEAEELEAGELEAGELEVEELGAEELEAGELEVEEFGVGELSHLTHQDESEKHHDQSCRF